MTAVAVTGFGCVSALGCDGATTRTRLRNGHDGAAPVTLFPTQAFRSAQAGMADAAFLNTAGFSRRWPRASRMVFTALTEALSMQTDFRPDVVIAATTSGGMDFGETFYRGLVAGRPHRSLRALSRRYIPQQPARDAMDVFGFDAPVRVISNACASGTNALGVATRLLRTGDARRVLVLAYDALCELVFAGFDALQAASPEKCRPFDTERSGLMLGEGAAALLLEADGHLPLAFVRGHGAASDNFHLTRPDPSGAGPRRAMERALADAGWTPESLDYINAHGTGTPFNDASEAAALRAVAPECPVSSTKAMCGHTLGAAGALEAAFCIHAMHGGFLPPNLHVRTPEPGIALVSNTARPATVRRVLSNSFGFGGSNATVALELP